MEIGYSDRSIGISGRLICILEKMIKKMIKDPSTIPDARLREGVERAVKADYLYAPWGHQLQVERARAGEAIIRKWREGTGGVAELAGSGARAVVA